MTIENASEPDKVPEDNTLNARWLDCGSFIAFLKRSEVCSSSTVATATSAEFVSAFPGQ
jgi:hypothetical protein